MPACEHCLLEFTGPAPVREEVAGVERLFCCEGCRGIFHLVHQEGLGDYYARRSWPEPGLATSDLQRPLEVESFAEAAVDEGGVRTLELYIDGIRCASCVWLNERILTRTPGVSEARVSYATHRARIRWDPALLKVESLLERIRAVGYRPRPYLPSQAKLWRSAEQKDLLMRLGTASFLASQLMIYSVALYAGYFDGIDPGTQRLFEVIALALTAPVVFYAGAPFFQNAVSGLRAGHFNMDSLVALGALAAFGYSVWAMGSGGKVYFDTAAMIITLILLGRYLESRARARASEAVERLADLAPRFARRLTGSGEIEEVPISQVGPGSRLEVQPGARVPADGVVESGRSEVDEALVTGESRPVSKQEGATVIAGTQNLYGNLVFRVTRVGQETTLAAIGRAVAEAQLARPRLQALADRVVGWFVPAIGLLALATAAVHLWRGAPASEALMIAVAVLVIACPCSLGLATPIAVLVASGAASLRGLLVKGGDVFERLSRVSDVVYDKTGTLTLARPSLKEVVLLPPEGMGQGALVAMAAALERRSEHSLAQAIRSSPLALREGPEPWVEDFRALPGRGVSGRVDGVGVLVGNLALLREEGIEPKGIDLAQIAAREAEGSTVVFLAVDGRARALLDIADPVRPEAALAIAAHRRQRLRVTLASGDGAGTTAAAGAQAGIERCRGELLPDAKQALVAELSSEGRGVLMVGDGINDAPALSRAEVGVAMGRGTDVALESADLVLLRSDLTLVPFAVELGRRTHRVIQQNVFWAFAYNLVAVPLAMVGMLHPIVAAAAMAASSLCVVGNALRLRKAGQAPG